MFAFIAALSLQMPNLVESQEPEADEDEMVMITDESSTSGDDKETPPPPKTLPLEELAGRNQINPDAFND